MRIGYIDIFMLGEGKYVKFFVFIISEYDFSRVSLLSDREF